MAISDKDVTWVEEPEMTFWEALFVPAIIDGLRTTARHVTGYKSVTQQYPEQRPELPMNYRGVHRLNKDDAGRVKCVACMMCATACPAKCIDIVAAPAPKNEEWAGRDKYPATFVIDELKCIYCGMCEEACPVDAIELTHIYDLVGTSRQDLTYDKEKLLDVFEQTKNSGRDPIRTHMGRLGPASEFESLPPLGPATAVPKGDKAARGVSSGVISS